MIEYSKRKKILNLSGIILNVLNFIVSYDCRNDQLHEHTQTKKSFSCYSIIIRNYTFLVWKEKKISFFKHLTEVMMQKNLSL